MYFYLGLILLLNLPTNLLVPILPDMSIPMAKVFSYDHLQLTELGMVSKIGEIIGKDYTRQQEYVLSFQGCIISLER